MSLFTILSVASAAVGAAGQLQAGRAAKSASELNAYNIKTENIQNQVLAEQQAAARIEDYQLATSANIATFGITRDVGSDKSVKAFLDRQKEVVGRDIGRIAQQKEMERIGSVLAAASERTRGKQAMTASIYSAVGTIANAGLKYYQTKT
jgi:hypothetical protein